MEASKVSSWSSVSEALTEKVVKEGFLFDLIRRANLDQKVLLCSQVGFVRECLEKWINDLLDDRDGLKSCQKSRDSRQLGNSNFTNPRNSSIAEALRLYNRSIIEAPARTEELSMALGNRSAVLYELKNYQKCLVDINLAVDNKYPKQLLYKLLIRKGKCLFYLKKYPEAIRVLETVKEDIIASGTVLSSKKPKLVQDVETFLKLAKSMDDAVSPKEGSSAVSEDAAFFPSLISKTSDSLPSASEHLSLHYSNEKGKHVLAVNDISMGDVLIVEKPYAHVLLQDHHESHCHHCCDVLTVPIPCWHCTLAIFCSLECQKEAWQNYHKWECSNALKIFHSIGIAHLAIRVLIKSTLDSSPKNEEKYKQVNDLVTHLDKFSDVDLFQYTLIATLLLIYLEQKTDFFQTTKFSGADDFGKVGFFLLRHVAQLICNGHAITAIRKVDSDSVPSSVIVQKPVRIATAIFPSASMLNHSCDPNICHSFFKDTLIIKASRNIPKGSEIFNCYGPDFRRMHVKYRKELLLDQYRFECHCEPCQIDSKGASFLDRFYESFLCLKCTGPSILVRDSLTGICLDCRHEQDCRKLYQKHVEAEKLYHDGCDRIKADGTLAAVNLALKSLLEALSSFEECLYKYHRDITECANQISLCYAMGGEFAKSISFLETTLPAVKEQFGPVSVEYGHELQKLSDVMMCELQHFTGPLKERGEKISKTRRTLKQFKYIFEIHFGFWDQQYKDLAEKESELQNFSQALG